MQASELFSVINRGKLTGVQIGVMVTCWLINMLDGFDVLAIAFAAPTISAAWQLQAGTLGVVLSAGLVGMALGAMFIAPLAASFRMAPLGSTLKMAILRQVVG